MLGGVPAAILGCSAVLNRANPEMVAQLGAVLCDNPNEPPNVITSHSHVLQLSQPVDELTDVNPDVAIDVHHVLSCSIVKSATLKVYRLAGVRMIDLDRSR